MVKQLILRLSLFLFILCVVWYGVYLIRHNASHTAQEARGEVFVSYIDKPTGL